MKRTILFITFICVFAMTTQAKTKKKEINGYIAGVKIEKSEKTLNTQWNGKTIAYLGDSMTDTRTLGRNVPLYWKYLQDLMGIKPYVYGKSGHQWHQIYRQAQKLWGEHKDSIDAIMIFAGTNDYFHSIPIGNFFDEKIESVVIGGPKTVKRKHRTPIMCDSTLCGRLNETLYFLKEKYPGKQIIILTPIHRGYAKFNNKNIQPDEYYCNALGLYLETYVETIKKAASYWSVPVIDLYSISGIVPNMQSNTPLMHIEKTDRLHPGTIGQYKIAKTIQYQIQSLPADCSKAIK